jgi:glutathione synthase/RimK-type ligase-like ATP-grasp enzyme
VTPAHVFEPVNWRTASNPAPILSVCQNRVDRLWQSGVWLESQGRTAEARTVWIELLELEPSHLGALSRLGALLADSGENHLAQEVFAEAVRQHPRDPMSRVNLANLRIKNEQYESAREQLMQALAIQPDFRAAHAGLAFVLARLGEPELGSLHGRVAFSNKCCVENRFRGTGAPIRVLELISTRGGNVRIQSFLRDRIFQRFVIPAEFRDPSATLPEHDLVVNAIGDADLAGPALAGAAALVRQTTAPVINSPSAVLATGRAAIAQRLCTIPGVRTPRMSLLHRDLLAGPRAAIVLADRGFSFPLLLRPPGFHGGEHFLKLDSAGDMPSALQALPGQELLAIEYLDAFRPDGKARKYRAMTIGGELYPLHCAVSHHWKIHYFSAEMAESPEHRAEDAAFLADMPGVLGAQAMQALLAVQDPLGLDYGGIDFSIGRNGDLLVFEANATMVILPPGDDERWNFRRPAVERACQAVHSLLTEKAAQRRRLGSLPD